MVRLSKFITIIFMVFFSQISLGNDVNGNFSCKVKSTPVIQMEDGFPKDYTGFKNGVQKNDEMYLNYEFSPLIDSITFQIKLPHRDFNFFASGRFEKDKMMNDYGTYFTDNNDIFINNNTINLDGNMHEINLERYYKNDWHGYIVRTGQDFVHVMTLNCIHNVDKFDKIISNLKQKGF